jgi:hypothetical protein
MEYTKNRLNIHDRGNDGLISRHHLLYNKIHRIILIGPRGKKLNSIESHKRPAHKQMDVESGEMWTNESQEFELGESECFKAS